LFLARARLESVVLAWLNGRVSNDPHPLKGVFNE
jgi:hypothetical protein